jgi:hypothetical protein
MPDANSLLRLAGGLGLLCSLSMSSKRSFAADTSSVAPDRDRGAPGLVDKAIEEPEYEGEQTPAGPPPSAMMIGFGGETFLRFGILAQPQADFSESPTTQKYAENLFVRRIRFIAAGQIVGRVSFFFETDDPNLGKSTTGMKQLGGFTVQDAILDLKIADELVLSGGLMLPPISRNNQQSAAMHLTLDYGSYTFLYSTPEQNLVGRDTGFVLKGLLFDKHLEYRAGIFQGVRDKDGSNAFRSAGRLQVDLLDPEPYLFYPGTYLGQKSVIALGAGYDWQKGYLAISGDVFVDLPIGPGAVTLALGYMHLDGGSAIPLLFEQHTFLGEIGYFISILTITPWFRYETQRFVADANKPKDEERIQAGLTYYLFGHNLNFKAAYGLVAPSTGMHSNTFTLQLQGFYF